MKKYRICILSQQHFVKKHVSEDTVNAFEEAIEACKKIDVLKIPLSELVFKTNRKIKRNLLLDYCTLLKIKRYKPDYIFIMAMAPGSLQHISRTLRIIDCPKIIYCIDTWESRMPDWIKQLFSVKANYIVCSNKRSVDDFKQYFGSVGFIPYSMNSNVFYPRNIGKEHLFMQMGRKNQTLHEWVLRYIQERGFQDSDYIREKALGQILYPSFEQLAAEISKTYFFICAPRNFDEQNITGNISDVTARFYEGMACKTLIVGFKPQDTFNDLFPSETAMIETRNYQEFKEKIDYYRNHYTEYSKIVDYNYSYLMENHSWAHRAMILLEFIDIKCDTGNRI